MIWKKESKHCFANSMLSLDILLSRTHFQNKTQVMELVLNRLFNHCIIELQPTLIMKINTWELLKSTSYFYCKGSTLNRFKLAKCFRRMTCVTKSSKLKIQRNKSF